MEQITLNKINNDLEFLKNAVVEIKVKMNLFDTDTILDVQILHYPLDLKS